MILRRFLQLLLACRTGLLGLNFAFRWLINLFEINFFLKFILSIFWINLISFTCGLFGNFQTIFVLLTLRFHVQLVLWIFNCLFLLGVNDKFFFYLVLSLFYVSAGLLLIFLCLLIVIINLKVLLTLITFLSFFYVDIISLLLMILDRLPWLSLHSYHVDLSANFSLVVKESDFSLALQIDMTKDSLIILESLLEHPDYSLGLVVTLCFFYHKEAFPWDPFRESTILFNLI